LFAQYITSSFYIQDVICFWLSERNASVVVDNEDEIFFGPMGYTEKCVAVAVNADAKAADLHKPIAPLSAVEMAQLCQEAFTVAR